MGAAPAIMRTLPLGFRWSFLWGHEALDGVCRHGRGAAMQTLPLGPWAFG